MNISNLTLDDRIRLLENDGKSIRHFPNPSYQMKKIAVQSSAWALMYIDEQTDELAKIALDRNGSFINIINNPSETLQDYAIKSSKPNHLYLNKERKSLSKFTIDCVYQYLIEKLPFVLSQVQGFMYHKTKGWIEMKPCVSLNGYIINYVGTYGFALKNMSDDQKVFLKLLHGDRYERLINYTSSEIFFNSYYKD